MGLDMYLYKKTYVGNKWKDPDKQAKIDVPGVNQSKVSEVVEEAMYWRKANAIHGWFVDNVQGGEDECQESYVTIEQLQELLELIRKVMKNHKLAPKLLPVQVGFFFGSEEYDDYYFEYLASTEEALTRIVRDNQGDYYYHSSW